ncbi:MAG: hybrid sensor histidine kinase/response regulator [Cyanobacteria bacterium P01_H01_bin.15]
MAEVLRRIVSDSKFEELCQLWQRVAQQDNRDTVLVTDADLTRETVPAAERERFHLLLGPEVNALLLGNVLSGGRYEAMIAPSPDAIADFLDTLAERLEQQTLSGETELALARWRSQAEVARNLSMAFWLEVMEVLTPERLGAETIATNYPNFGQTELVREAQQAQQIQARILEEVSFQIRENQAGFEIIELTIEQVRRFLQLDRLVIYQLEVSTPETSEPGAAEPQRYDTVTFEAVAGPDIPSILYFNDETCFSQNPDCRDRYRRGFSLAVDDVQNANMTPCLRQLMERLKIRAKLVMPILVKEQLWGFLIAHACYRPRRWRQREIKFLRQVADYLAIAVYQAQSFQQLQVQQDRLEAQVNQRAEELQTALIAAEMASQAKNDFLRNLSHELRTPLTSVIGLSNTLLHWRKLDKIIPADKERRYLQSIQNSGRRLLTLIDDLFDLSELQTGKSLLNVRQFSLILSARRVISAVQDRANLKQMNLELDFRVPYSQDVFAGDSGRIEQMLIQLLDNGIKFTPSNGLVVLRIWRSQNEVYFQVEDSGIGVDAEKLPLLFETFQQLERAPERTYSGIGLGLALVKQLAEMHRGQIEVQSVVGQGTTFTIRIPNQLEVTPVPPAPVPAPAGEVGPTSQTIVLVEPEELAASIICEILTNAKYGAVWLVDSPTAANQIELLQPLLVILDEHVINAGEITRYLQTLPLQPQIWLVCAAEPDNWSELQAFGFNDYLLRPIQPDQLLSKVNAIAEAADSEPENP